MEKKKKIRRTKPKPKRNKKYQGATAQSNRAKGNEDNYKPSIDFLLDYNSKIDKLSSQIQAFTTPIYQPSFVNAMTKFNESISSFHKIESLLPKIASFPEMSQAFDLSRKATLAFAELSKPVLHNNLASLISKVTLPSNAAISALNIAKTNQLLYEALKSQSLIAYDIQSNFAKATELSLFAEKSLSTFAWKDIGVKIGLSELSKNLVSSSFLEFSTDYSELLKSYVASPTSFIAVSPSVNKLIPIEYYTGANLLEAITVEEDSTQEEENLKKEIQYENEFSLNLYLPKVNDGLLKMWKGAIETYHSNNPDKIRQFTTSIRELLGHLMRILAPDDEIKKWTIDESCYYDGKPTRKARLQYICRNISSKPFDTFIDKDIKATLELIQIFQNGTHNIESNFTPAQLVALKSKAEAIIKFLLEIEFSTNK